MTGIVWGLIVLGFVPVTFFICDGSEYSCQVVRAASVLFGLMALAMTGVLGPVDNFQNGFGQPKYQSVEKRATSTTVVQ